MSLIKIDLLFPGFNEEITKKQLTKIIAYSLQKDFGKESSTIKIIGQHTGANLRSVKNWYNGATAPSSIHFMQLLKISPTLKRCLIVYLFGEEFWNEYMLIERIKNNDRDFIPSLTLSAQNTKNNDPINDPIKLNESQKWFLINLKSGKNIGAKDVAKQFNISLSTAKRYIKKMRDHNIIRFIGSNKTGSYEVVDLI